MSDVQREFDVAVIGGGIGGSILAAVLARHDVRVLLIEGGSHPRFAIGESTIPETTFGLRNLARRYGVPEIENLATHAALRRNVSASCGIKRNFSFVHHREGEPAKPRESTQFLTFAPPLGPDAHFLRQEVDAYLFHVAVSYGTTAHTNTFVTGLDFDDEGVDIVTETKGTFRASYIVDAGGIRAFLPQLLGLREKEPQYRTRTRSIFTHMVNVQPFDAVAAPQKEHGMRSPFSQGTLHHLFEGGWIWVIPFDNHLSSTSKMCSVGLNLDLDRYPRPKDLTPEEEFWHHLRRFPSVAEQFKDAKAVRPFMANDRSQFASRQVVGDRWCLLPHASDFIDPLFSSGLTVTVFALHALGHRLINAVRTKDFGTAHFAYLETWIKRMFRYYDDLVSCSYLAFDDFELWNAWYRVWTTGSVYGTNSLNQAALAFERTGDPAAFLQLERPPYRGLQGIDNPAFERLFTEAVAAMRAHQSGERTREATIDRIYELLRESELCPPVWNMLDPDDHAPAGTFTPLSPLRVLLWGRFRAPEHIRGDYFTGGVRLVTRELRHALSAELRRGGAVVRQAVRDLVRDWNRDWARRPSCAARSGRTDAARSVTADEQGRLRLVQDQDAPHHV